MKQFDRVKVQKRLAKSWAAFFCVLVLLVSYAVPVFQATAAAAAPQQVVVEATSKSAYSPALYHKLRSELNAVMREKGFSDLTKKFLREILLNTLKNYNQWRTGYRDMPNAAAYLRENLIDALKNVNHITLIDENSKKGRKMLARGSAKGYTDGDFNIVLLYTDPATIDFDEHLSDLESLYHEIKHCKDKKVIFRYKHYQGNWDLRDILVEGGATFHQKFVVPLSAFPGGAWCLGDDTGRRELAYEKNNCIGYLLHLYLYETLVYLAGYRTVEDVSMGSPVMDIKNAIAKKYGSKTADRIWKDILTMHHYYEDDVEGVDLYAFAIRLQKEVLKCVKKDIKRLNVNKPGRVKAYMEIYRFYKLKVMPKIYEDTYTDVTTSVFDTEPLDDLLIDKIVASGAMPQLMEDPALQRSALRALLYVTASSLPGRNRVNVPPTVSATQIIVSPEEEGGKMILHYVNEEHRQVRVTITFGADGLHRLYGRYYHFA